MRRNRSFFHISCKRFLWNTLAALTIVFAHSCTSHITPIYSSYLPFDSIFVKYQPQKEKWLNWNILFAPGTSEARRIQTMDSIEKYVTNWISSSPNPSLQVTHFYFSCPCDPQLTNYTATPLLGMSGTPNPPPNPGKGVGGSGDGIQYVNSNNSFVMDTTLEYQVPVNQKVVLNTTSVDDSKILAVMDTGLDTLIFPHNFQNLLWSDAAGQNLRNFQFFTNGRGYDYYFDDEKHKHGTAVTTLALQAFESFNLQNTVKPRVMILKVLDENKRGSTFTVSCALSYVKQHAATMVNASLGYYGKTDSILLKYSGDISNADQNPIPVFSAAGNIPGIHADDSLCNPPLERNLLNSSNLFYPACFSDLFPNFITVTGLSDAITSCYYQNYSSQYVNVGVITNPGTPNCCRFLVPFNTVKGYEGSSFATPVVSGKVMACLMTTAGITLQTCIDLISPVPNPIPPNPATKQGRALTYTTP